MEAEGEETILNGNINLPEYSESWQWDWDDLAEAESNCQRIVEKNVSMGEESGWKNLN